MPSPCDRIRLLVRISGVQEEQEAVLPIEVGEYVSFYGRSFNAHVFVEEADEEAVTLEFLADHPASTRYDGKVQKLRKDERFQCSLAHVSANGETERISFLAVYDSNERSHYAGTFSPSREF